MGFLGGFLGDLLGGPSLAFLGISALVIATPGPDAAMTIRNTLLGGRAGGLAIARIGTLLGRTASRRTLDGITGAVLIGLGLRLAAEDR